MRKGWSPWEEDPGESDRGKSAGGDPAGGDPAAVDVAWSEFLAETTAPGENARELPARLCAACVRLLPVAGASISIVGSRGSPVTLCASDEVAALLAEIQYSLGEGPCRCATRLKAPVMATDLTDGPDPRRWPLFARQAVTAGASAVFSFPLGQAGSVLGTLDLYNTVPGHLAEQYVPVAVRAAEAMTLALTEELREALKERAAMRYNVDKWSIRRIAKEEGYSYGLIHQLLTEAKVQFRDRRGNQRP